MDTFDLKKFITEGRLLKEGVSNRHHHPGHDFLHQWLDASKADPNDENWEDTLRASEIGGYEGYYDDVNALKSLIRQVDAAGGETELWLEPYEVSLETTGDHDTLKVRIIQDSDWLNEGQYADNTIEMDGHDIDLDSFQWEIYNKDRTDPELVYAEYTNGEELSNEHYEALNDMYFDDFNEWVWTYGTAKLKESKTINEDDSFRAEREEELEYFKIAQIYGINDNTFGIEWYYRFSDGPGEERYYNEFKAESDEDAEQMAYDYTIDNL